MHQQPVHKNRKNHAKPYIRENHFEYIDICDFFDFLVMPKTWHGLSFFTALRGAAHPETWARGHRPRGFFCNTPLMNKDRESRPNV
jgi:hypothetical protein